MDPNTQTQPALTDADTVEKWRKQFFRDAFSTAEKMPLPTRVFKHRCHADIERLVDQLRLFSYHSCHSPASIRQCLVELVAQAAQNALVADFMIRAERDNASPDRAVGSAK